MTLKQTRLCYWIARPAKPGVQSSNTSRVCFTIISQTPGCSRFYHIHIVSKRKWDGACLMNLTQQVTYIFKFAIRSITLLNLGETCHLKGHDMVTLWHTLLLLLRIMTSRCLNTCCDVTQCMNGLRIFMTKLESPNGSNPSKQWGMCDDWRKLTVL